MVKRLRFLLGKHVVNGNLGVRDADPVYTAIALNKANRVSNTPPLPSRLLPRLGQCPRVGHIDLRIQMRSKAELASDIVQWRDSYLSAIARAVRSTRSARRWMCSSRVCRFTRLNRSQVRPAWMTVLNQASPEATTSDVMRA
jgi:hypothetical protein